MAVLCASCDRFRSPTRHGSLAEISASGLHVYPVNGAFVLSIENNSADHRCLLLDGVSVTVDGVKQKMTSPGGGSRLPRGGMLTLPNQNVLCSSAMIALSPDHDVLRKTNHIEVTDGTTTWKMEIPNIVVTPSWITPPPAVTHEGASFTVRIAPDFPRGTAYADRPTILMAWLDEAPNGAGMPIHSALEADGSITIDIRSDAPAGNHTLSVSSQQASLKASACGADYCTAASDFRITAPIAIAP